MTDLIPDLAILEILGRGLSHKQWRIVLEGGIFNDCIGGRYFTEWQHALGCRSFRYCSTTKQRLVELEFETFRDEIETMVLEGYDFKSIARRLRGEVWRDDGIHETEERLRTKRLCGPDARSRMFRSAVKRWKMDGPRKYHVKRSQVQYGQDHIQRPLQQKTQCHTLNQDERRPAWIPEAVGPSKSNESFRCSFSNITTLALQQESQSSNQLRTFRTPRQQENETTLYQALYNLQIKSQQSKEELRAMKADLQSIRAGLQEHEREIAMLRGRPVQRPLPPTIIDEFDENFLRHEEQKEERCRSRRRGRVFRRDKIYTSPQLGNRQCSRIPVRALSPGMHVKIDSDSMKVSMTRSWSRSPIPTNEKYESNDKTQRYRRAVNQDRDSGYASPSSTYSSAHSTLSAQTRLVAVRE